MKIGVVGYGVVGAAVGESLKELGHEVSPHDITMDTQLADVLGSVLCFLCVPTPKNEKGECEVAWCTANETLYLAIISTSRFTVHWCI